MNEYYYQKTKYREKCIDKYIVFLVKRMGWKVYLPKLLRAIIVSFIYPSFYCRSTVYALIYHNIQLKRIRPLKSNWIVNGEAYLVETRSQIIQFEVIYQWNTWQGSIRQAIPRFLQSLKRLYCLAKQQNKGIEWLSNARDLSLINRILRDLQKYIQNIHNQLLEIILKNIIAIETPHHIYCIIRQAQINHSIDLQFCHMRRQWLLLGQALLWQRGVNVNQNKQWIRFTKHSIHQIEGPFITNVPYDIFPQDKKRDLNRANGDDKCMQYLVE